MVTKSAVTQDEVLQPLETVSPALEQKKTSGLKLDIPSTGETIIMRHGPLSPARNRSVRSDFLSNFVKNHTKIVVFIVSNRDI